MAVRTPEVEADLIDAVCRQLRDRLVDQAPGWESFVRQYYHWVPPQDLSDRSIDDMAGAAASQWGLGANRPAGKAKLRVFNPDPERDGWQLPYTVIEIVSDDMPFIVDSVTMTIARLGHAINLVIHPVIRVKRDANGDITEVVAPGEDSDTAIAESVMHAEVTREPDAERLGELQTSIERVLEEVRAAVEDWQAMRERTLAVAAELGRGRQPLDPGDVEEARAFLTWLADDHFTFLGYREYELEEHDGGATLRVLPGSGLGILRAKPANPAKRLSAKQVELAHAKQLLVLTKANSRATVHRPSYLDYIGVKRFDAEGKVIGEWRLLGLYTTAAYKTSTREIPMLRGKVSEVLDHSGFPPDSHDAKALADFLETYPRDGLFQIDEDELFNIAMGVIGLGERPRVRLFIHHDPLERFVSCLVTIPRDRFNTDSRERVGHILLEAFGGSHVDWALQLSESVLARVHYVVHCIERVPSDYDADQIEARLIKAVRAWSDDLRVALIEELGEERGVELHRRYEEAFPPGYRSDVGPARAVADILRLERLYEGESPIVSLYETDGWREGGARCKLYSAGVISLSDVLPTFEHMGAKVVDERPYRISPIDRDPAYVYDFGLRCPSEDIDAVRETFENAFLEVCRGNLEDDGLNGLVLRARLSAREVTIVRAVGRYLRQAAIAYSDAYIVRTLLAHADVAALLVKLFFARLDPDRADEDRAAELTAEIEETIDQVRSLDEDRILRSFLAVVGAILRTSFFRDDEAHSDGTDRPGPRPYLSFKLDPERIPALPRPRPRFEIFVYSPRFEAVHLRGGKVARGGIRWSERPEDFRTEVLGLMKAQMVKNALIVPVGSKGGFVLKRPPREGGREALTNEAVVCYRLFLSGLLDLTDNYAGNEVKPPPRVIRHDGDDPYLVVAADKGTATFSDIANDVSARYGYWLGDAFASGGSHGYDHKAMGITARGAWEAVKRHFRELGIDIQTSDFTVVGIGDMSGDVFGNGMLLSRHIRLLGAFNHMHVFLDPDPDPARSYEERKRLFELGRSAWSDYDESLISEGGGIYLRSAKSIPISPQAQAVLGIEADELSPAELIQHLLRAPVDLVWNGGIGTYVKASNEGHSDAGDKANDAVRVDAKALCCRVVGEGGNLGFTQRGRIEYALSGGPEGKGGLINTDAIDNVGGVNCSDHEVNIKILLDALVAKGELTPDERNELLGEMTESVAKQVLYGSYTQTQALSLAAAQAPPMFDVHARLMRFLEQNAGLDRELEFLPSDEEIGDRTAAHQGLMRPELAVVMAYCKIYLYAQLLDSELPEDPYLAHDLERYFPSPLPERFGDHMPEHRLRREIVATIVANQLVDRAGTTFIFRLREETGAPPSLLARAYAVAREVFGMREFWESVERLDNVIDASVQIDMLLEGRRLVERAARWLVHSNPHAIDVQGTIEHFTPGAERLAQALPGPLEGSLRERFEEREAALRNGGVPEQLARQVAGMPATLAALDLVSVADVTGRELDTVSEVFFRLGSGLELQWLHERIVELPRADRWQALGRTALRDDLYNLHRWLTEEVLRGAEPEDDPETAIEDWRESRPGALQRALSMLSDIRASRRYDMTTLSVALREVRHLIRGGADEDAGPGEP
ncbi:MAG TPA: NAD-glutamate dehydrogenase [Solirubrobacteraceae bacterium]|nr:NAD-glutamate dehydrogenase [Solirubrobacteraceae bacterium]